MTFRCRCLAPMFAFALPLGAAAQDLHGDGARIEALLRAERNGGAAHAAPATARPAALRTNASVAPGIPARQETPPSEPAEAAELGFDDLRELRGKAVRIEYVGGGVRVGTVESADRNKVTLNVRMGGGYARYDLARDRVQSVTLLQR